MRNCTRHVMFYRDWSQRSRCHLVAACDVPSLMFSKCRIRWCTFLTACLGNRQEQTVPHFSASRPMGPKPPFDFSPPSPPETSTLTLTFPDKHILLLMLNRPGALNVLTTLMEEELGKVMDWFDEESSLRWVCLRRYSFDFNS